MGVSPAAGSCAAGKWHESATFLHQIGLLGCRRWQEVQLANFRLCSVALGKPWIKTVGGSRTANGGNLGLMNGSEGVKHKDLHVLCVFTDSQKPVVEFFPERNKVMVSDSGLNRLTSNRDPQLRRLCKRRGGEDLQLGNFCCQRHNALSDSARR